MFCNGTSIFKLKMLIANLETNAVAFTTGILPGKNKIAEHKNSMEKAHTWLSMAKTQCSAK